MAQIHDLRPPESLSLSTNGCEPLAFRLPQALEASEPPEARGLARDDLRLLVSYFREDRVVHTRFRDIVGLLNPGDVLVINTSGTLKAALHVSRPNGTPLELHLSTQLPANLWVVELRQPQKGSTSPFYDSRAGEHLQLPGGGRAILLTAYRPDQRHEEHQVRLWIASLELPDPLMAYLDRHGFPIRYGYVRESWPISYYQNVYATEMGSAEMPSAGRPFTPELLTQLVARGIHVAPLVLHTGVASLEDHEPPYTEFYRVPLATAQLVNDAHAHKGSVVAVGTTVVRALETVADEAGAVHPGEGWTRLVVTPARGLRAVDGLLTGLHEPRASHLAMLEALAGCRHLNLAYQEALRHGYLWHEFGDLHLLLPDRVETG